MRLHAAVLILPVFACSTSSDPTPAPSPATPIAAAIDALGGEEAVAALGSLHLKGAAKTYEPGQTLRPSDPPIEAASYTFDCVDDAAHDRAHIEYDRAPGWPFFLAFKYGAVLEDQAGLFTGTSGWVSQVLKSAGSPMRADRLAAMRKTERMEQPQLVLLEALQHSERARALADATYGDRPNHVTEVDDPNGRLRVFTDASTNLPSKVETLEDDPVLGDVLVEASYDAWSDRGGVKLPDQITFRVAGMTTRVVTRSDVAPLARIDEALFPAAPPKPSAPMSALGANRAANYDRYLDWGYDLESFPPPPDTVKLSEIGAGTKIFHVTGVWHHSLAIEMNASVVVVEAPIDDARSKVVIDAIKKQIPNKPITHLVNTHHHHDHSGGVRTYVAAGATIVTATQNERFFRDMAAAPHTVVPDTLAASPKDIVLALVGSDPLTITDGRAVQVMPFPTPHSDGMLVVYVPDAKVLFQADLYAPGLGAIFGQPLANPPVGKVFVEGPAELSAWISAQKLPVDFLVAGHGIVGPTTLSDLAKDIGR